MAQVPGYTYLPDPAPEDVLYVVDVSDETEDPTGSSKHTEFKDLPISNPTQAALDGKADTADALKKSSMESESPAFASVGLNQSLYTLPASLYGANIRNVLYKLRHKDLANDEVRIVIMGDDILDDPDSWADLLESYLEVTYGSDNLVITKVAYSGYGMAEFIKIYESHVIDRPIDLWIFSEYEDNWQFYHALLDHMIQTVRRRSTADIAIGTWSTNLGSLQSPGTYYDDDRQIAMEKIRAIARRYGCEILDVNEALYREVLSGTDPDTLFQTTDPGEVRPSIAGHQAIFDREIKLHFAPDHRLFDVPNPREDVEFFYHLAEQKLFPRIPPIATLSGSWAASLNEVDTSEYASKIASAVNTDYWELPFTGIGVEILSLKTIGATQDVTIDDGGEVVVAPSAMQVNGYPLEFATEILPSVGMSPTKRLFKAIVTQRWLDDGENERNFEIEFLTPTTYKVTDTDNSVQVGSPGDITVDSTFPGETRGQLLIPAQYAGGTNFDQTGGAFAAGDKATFKIVSNWVDTIAKDPVTYLSDDDVVNGDFETGPPFTGWTANGGATFAAGLERTGGSGTQSIEIDRGTSELVAYTAAMTWEAGKTYRVEFWADAEVGNEAYVRVDLGAGEVFQSELVSGVSWASGYVDVTPSATKTGAIRLYIIGVEFDYAAFDDITRREIEPSPGTLSRRRIYGLENKAYKLKVTKTNAVASSFVGVKVFRPPMGR